MTDETMDARRLNRATLDRQRLLVRGDVSAKSVIEHLVGLNAQDAEPPHLGLWNRIDGFDTGRLSDLLAGRIAVRAPLFRGTQHIVTAGDYLWLRPLLDPMLRRIQRGAFGKTTRGIDPDELAAVARALIAAGDGELTRPELGAALTERWPDRPAVDLARSAQLLVPVVHPYPDGSWGWRGRTPFALADQWIGRHLAEDPDPEALVERYLAAFGPATVADLRAWSGLPGLGEVVDRVRPRLRRFGDESGRELLDLPDAPRPDPDTPAPARFLPALDNVVLAHNDRSRIAGDDQRSHLVVDAAVTVDGFVQGLWRIRRDDGDATVIVRLFRPLAGADVDEVTEEGLRLVRFAAPDADRHLIRFLPIDEPWPPGTPWHPAGRLRDAPRGGAATSHSPPVRENVR